MFAPSSEEVRRFFAQAWRDARAGLALQGAAAIAAAVAERHPEYHHLLEDIERAIDAQFTPEDGQMSPFLHLSLHLAVEEHLGIDQPPGIRDHYMRILRSTGNEHDAQHVVMECLGEILWKAQREGRGPDGQAYLDCLAAASGLRA